ncbi:CvpA family protein [Herpetosiphon llansteffanensis]|uniref:CvpA family protein n=1 Tax=Herpetosiphon llansteffanensis TaxID=2094568 RepID=UPI000D7CD025|nr:CvpA family protein [Herpetosiphon llansteffanensis]
MTILDWVLIGIMLWYTVLGYYWGTIRQLLALVGLITAIAIAGRMYPSVTDLLISLIPATAPGFISVLAFLLSLLAITGLVSAIASWLRLKVGLLFLGRTDHVIGAILGLVQAIVLIGAGLAGCVGLPQIGIIDAIQQSTLAEYLGPVVLMIVKLLPETFLPMNQMLFG